MDVSVARYFHCYRSNEATQNFEGNHLRQSLREMYYDTMLRYLRKYLSKCQQQFFDYLSSKDHWSTNAIDRIRWCSVSPVCIATAIIGIAISPTYLPIYLSDNIVSWLQCRMEYISQRLFTFSPFAQPTLAVRADRVAIPADSRS